MMQRPQKMDTKHKRKVHSKINSQPCDKTTTNQCIRNMCITKNRAHAMPTKWKLYNNFACSNKTKV